MKNNIRLKKCFVESLNVSENEICDDFSYGSVGWDSVAHMALVASIENEFDIMLDTDDVIDMSSVGKAKDILSKYKINFNSDA